MPNPTSALRPRAKLTFGRDASPSLTDRRDHPRRDPRTRSRSVRVDACPVRTSVSSAMQPPIVYRSRLLCTSTASRSGCGPTTSSRSSRERVRRARAARRGIHAQSQEHRADVGRGQREPSLHHRNPLLEPVVVHLQEVLDVHQLVADLDGVGSPAESR